MELVIAYITAHPWWTLAYLLCLSGLFRVSVKR